MVVRAIFFDFYGVWTPDIFTDYLAQAQQQAPAVANELEQIVEQYFYGQVDPTYVADAFRFKLGRADIDSAQFIMREQDIFPAIVDFMRNLHGHFVKLGILANLGTQEYELLNNFNQHNQVFEAITGPLPLHIPQPLLSQEVFAQALQMIGEPPRSCVVVSGNQAYLQFAQSLGITALPYEGFPKLQQTLAQLLTTETT